MSDQQNVVNILAIFTFT